MARHMVGLSIRTVARTAGLSPSQAGRIERAELRSASIDQLARLGASVGLDVRVRAYPGPDPIRDAAQVGLLERFCGRLHAGLSLITEVPVGGEGDQRAWDAMVGGFIDDVGELADLPVEAETRIADIQAQVRRIALKQRDSGREHVLLLISDTWRNREAIRAA